MNFPRSCERAGLLTWRPRNSDATCDMCDIQVESSLMHPQLRLGSAILRRSVLIEMSSSNNTEYVCSCFV